MASPSETFTLERRTISGGYDFNNPSWDTAWLKLGRTQLVAMSLQGHEESLFKKHLNFKSAKDKMGVPKQSEVFCLNDLTSTLKIDKLQKRWKIRRGTIIEGIYLLQYSSDETTGANNDECEVGAPYVHQLLRLLVDDYPAKSFSELHIEYCSKKKLVGGSVDIAVGTTTNGKKPFVFIEDQKVSLLLGSLGEAKAADVAVASTKECKHNLNDVKCIIQPMLELMAIGEVASFPCDAVPIVNIMANKSAFRPLLWWRDLDVLVTTPYAVPLRRSQTEIDIQGLLLMFVIFRLSQSKDMSFDKDKIRVKPKTGWSNALAGGSDNYKSSKVTIAPSRSKLVHQDAPYYVLSSTSSESSDECESTDKPRSKKRKYSKGFL